MIDLGMLWWRAGRIDLGICAVWTLPLVACGGASRGESNGSPGGHGGRGVEQAGRGQGGARSATGGAGGKPSKPAGAGGMPAGSGGHDASGGAADDGGRGGGAAGRGGTPNGGARATGGKGGSVSGGAGASGGKAGSSMGGAGAGAGGAAQGGTSSLGAVEPAVKAYCGAVTSCCTAATPLDVCESTYASHSANFASLAAGTVTVDADQLARCQAAYAGASQCDQNTVWDACQGVFVGTRAVNEPCKNGFDCDRSNGFMTCLITDGSTPGASGTCIAVPRAALGDACVTTCESGKDCSSTTYGVGDTYALCFEEDGLYCAYVGPGSVCKSIVPLDSPCSNEAEECGSEAYCDTTCKALSKLGDACGNGCRHELQCDDATSKCVDPTWATEYGCTMGYALGL